MQGYQKAFFMFLQSSVSVDVLLVQDAFKTIIDLPGREPKVHGSAHVVVVGGGGIAHLDVDVAAEPENRGVMIPDQRSVL